MLRLRHQDKNTLDLAAKALQLSQADFCRAMVVNGAREVLSQLGILEPVLSVTHVQQNEPVCGADDGD